MSRKMALVSFVLCFIVCGFISVSSAGAKEPEADFDKSDSPNAQPASTEVVNASPDADTTALFKAVKELVGEFYPKAKIKIDKTSMHIEFKTRPFDVPSTNTIEPGPNWGGILVDLNLKKGPYTGIHQVPKKFNEYSYYHVVLMAPYSKDRDCHLLARVAYPFDRSAEFVKRLSDIVNGFEEYL